MDVDTKIAVAGSAELAQGIRVDLDGGLIGRSASHREILGTLERVANTDAEVLITGPTGVGKELYARHLHAVSRRSGKQFVPVNCGALPLDLVENELFGHVGGAFTGALPTSDGLVGEAEGGTLFLDEVDALAPSAQVKLLRFIQRREYRRLGETRLRRANVRIVAATNAELRERVEAGAFREDLFFRLRVVPVIVPALCERVDDIGPLAEAFVRQCAERYDVEPIELGRAALAQMEAYDWPGNVRELENCVRYLTCLQLERPAEPTDLPLLGADGDARRGNPAVPTTLATRAAGAGEPLARAKKSLIDAFESAYLRETLRKTRGNITRAAERSGKARRAFFELLRKHHINARDFDDDDADEPGGARRRSG